jgi:Fe-S oxidoreductase
MLELRFDPAICRSCEGTDCLTRCKYLGLTKEQARAEILNLIEGRPSTVPGSCVTCYACEEYCPYGNHPFYRIVEQQEKEGILTAPRPITTQWVNTCEPTGRFRVGKIQDRALSLCFIPAFADLVPGALFEGISASYFMGAEFFCNVVYLHFARPSVIKERLPKVVENIAALGAKEVIFLHDECYASFKSLAPAYGIDVPFKSTHYYEYLLERLAALRDRITPLNIRVAYQRPCSSRLIPETDGLVDEIFSLIGVERAARQYDRDNAVCCSGLIRMLKRPDGYDLAYNNQKKNIDDMLDAGAEHCVFNCPYCYLALSEKVAERGLKPIHMIDLCKLAIGETPGKGVMGYGRYL